ncbi:hypothetical protein [Haloechinothrix salitolerans]|uniref:Uncharacterized protein n=1 Tax=Haloechinothrix salitolerans TaxID=926830 RepID=A0ABW2C0R5_9PSEU
MAKKILIAQLVLVIAAVAALAMREYPGLLREIKILRMARHQD